MHVLCSEMLCACSGSPSVLDKAPQFFVWAVAALAELHALFARTRFPPASLARHRQMHWHVL